jgi:hypothetical protein
MAAGVDETLSLNSFWSRLCSLSLVVDFPHLTKSAIKSVLTRIKFIDHPRYVIFNLYRSCNIIPKRRI